MAWAFAYTYVVCQAIYPGSFAAAVDPTAQRDWIRAALSELTTLSSTGLSDVVPIRPFERGLVMFEMIAGVAYLTIVVSRLVALTVLRLGNPAAAAVPDAATSGVPEEELLRGTSIGRSPTRCPYQRYALGPR